MSNPLSVPPASPAAMTPGPELARRLSALVGASFRLTGKTRTDGSNLRRRIAEAIERHGDLPAPAEEGTWRVVPPKKKGVPRIRREFLDTYIVTSGSSYNLQVWNRNPSEPIPQIEYTDGSFLRANDVRFVLTRIDVQHHVIRCVVAATPDYIVQHFGKFGAPTVKEQLIILPRARQEVLSRRPPILFYPDTSSLAQQFKTRVRRQRARIHDSPEPRQILSLGTIRRFVQGAVIGRRIEPDATKNRGQKLEQFVARGLGYTVPDTEVLLGGYPDIRHQSLEVKIQDAPTVDLGRYSPQFDEDVPACPGFTTQTVRYLIALTDPPTGVCLGAVLCPGKFLTQHFVYVAEQSFKCQRSIPMAFFDRFDGKSVFNPPYP